MNAFIIILLIVVLVLLSVILFVANKDYPQYKKSYKNICDEGITVELKKGSIGKVGAISIPPANSNVKVKIPCAPID